MNEEELNEYRNGNCVVWRGVAWLGVTQEVTNQERKESERAVAVAVAITVASAGCDRMTSTILARAGLCSEQSPSIRYAPQRATSFSRLGGEGTPCHAMPCDA